jgi:1-aminocyclopropane-1-carboxylate deaminase/D-cysteine desulfhydrase-like pyridoxal-dependent ACC family enzyme
MTAPSTTRLTPDALRERIARLPRIPFAFTPTPLEEAPKLRAALGPAAPRILIKRDDLTGFAFGGNKVRALEFRMAHVLANGYDAFVLVNIGQSNHARLHAAACTRLGIKMVIVKPGPKNEVNQGNLLLDRMVGVDVVETGTTDPAELEKALDAVLDDLRRQGYTPFASTREPFSSLAGTIAFAEASIELTDQLRAVGAAVGAEKAQVFLVGGTSATGLALGGKLLGSRYRVQQVSVGGDAAALRQRSVSLAKQVAELLDLPPVLEADDFDAHDEYVGARYADVTPAVKEAIKLLARTDAIFLDPVYTGKAMSGLIGEIRKGRLGPDQTAVFVHTGGLPIIFAYNEILQNLDDV